MLREQGLGSKSAEVLADFLVDNLVSGLPQLSHINLSKNQLRDYSIGVLFHSIKAQPELISLDLSSNELTPRGIQ